MKFPMRIFLAAVVSTVALTINHVSAQQTIATWWCGPLIDGGGAPPAPFTNNTAYPTAIVYPMTKGAGIGAVTTGGAYGGNTWTNTGLPDSEANSIASNLYITYAVQAAPGYTVSFSTNYIFIHASSTGPHNSVLEYSTDGTNYTDIASITLPSGTVSAVWTNILATNSLLQNIPSTTTNFFRIVSWGATGPAGTWYIYDPPPANSAVGTNDFVIDGALTPIPSAQNLATWWCGPLVDGGGATPAPFTNNTAAPNLTVYPLTKGSGIGAVTTGDAYGGNTWTNTGLPDTEANSIANGLYVTCAIQAATNYSLYFYTNYIFIHASSTGPHNSVLEYSTDGVDYTDIASITLPSGTVSAIWTNNLSTNNFLQNVPSTTTNFFRIVSWGATGPSGTWYIYDPPPGGSVVGTNDLVVVGGVSSLNGVIAPTEVVVTPSSITANAGQTVTFSVSALGSPASNSWYEVNGSTASLIPGATSSRLTFSSVVAGESGSFFTVLTNSAGSATSEIATLTVVDDPNIEAQPANTFGLLDGTVQFAATAFGTTPLAYQWYFTDANGDLIAPVNNGEVLPNGSVVASGANSTTLTINNMQYGDLTNFVLVVTNGLGTTAESSVASILGVNLTSSPLAFWDFASSNFIDSVTNPTCTLNPVPFLGVGTAQAVGSCYDPGTSPFVATTSADSAGGAGAYFFGMPGPQPGYSWGVDNLPLNSSNKQCGVQFNVSTVGAKNIKLTYDARVTSTASEFERVQYTTNGQDWIDYPAATSFNGIAGVAGTGWEPYPGEDFFGSDPLLYDNYPASLSTYFDFTGFPDVANNPDFGVRIVSEVEYTATYGIITTNSTTNYLGVANIYANGDDAGTMTYDLVTLYGDAITNNNVPPVISPIYLDSEVVTNESTLDTIPLTNTFTVSGDTTADKFTYSAQSLNPDTVNPTFTFSPNADGNCTMVIHPNPISQNVGGAPILVTVTDTNGDSVAAWFLLTVMTEYPTPTVAGLTGTNTLANQALSVPFMVSSPTDSVDQFTYSASSGNNTVVPSGNISVSTSSNPTNPVVTITPGSNELGVAVVNVTVNDNDAIEPKTTTASIPFMVRPNTNVIAIDYFNYDNSGPLETVSDGYWSHLSGIYGQMQVNSSASGGTVTVNTVGNTENLQAPLLGAPYSTNANAAVTTLYCSFIVNMSQESLPAANGTYFATFNDGSGITGNVEDLLVAATNGAALGDYRLGIADDNGATAVSPDIAMVPEDLAPGQNYVVVTSLVLSNGLSTIWVNPSDSSSTSYSSQPDGDTITYNIKDFELRESGGEDGNPGGAINVSYLKVGTTFDSVFPTLHVRPAGTNYIINWSDPTLGIQGATNVVGPYTDISPASPPYTNNASTNDVMFFRFGR